MCTCQRLVSDTFWQIASFPSAVLLFAHLLLNAAATTYRYAALASKWKEPAKDALDTLILNAVDIMSLDHMELLEHTPFDPVVKR